ncbi:MAG: nicotinate-nucleotide--dimethylbenzimidazole phosphoribosyltransferase [Lachnospiraceae bacterium]|nr:nicotinate-nucleotide--dimethylbenzimidazole phosphoribosyltransferase [Lachnospiraceae bacterium]
MDLKIYENIKSRWDSISKPIDGLGDFEDVICKIGAVQGTVEPDIENKALVIMCADNGIVKEGVSQCGPEVTLQVARALGSGHSTASVMAREAGIKCIPVDIGIDHEGKIPGVIDHKIRRGSSDFLLERALNADEVRDAVDTGIRMAGQLASEGHKLIAAGEMGIGNTTTATALLCLMTGADPKLVTGRGAGLDDASLIKKTEVIRKAYELYARADTDDKAVLAYDYLGATGGLDIAGLCGIYLGGQRYGIPIVIDGLVSGVAGLLADAISPGCRDYMIPSHSGRETGLMRVLDELELKPLICGNMALGEGTGAIMVCKLLDSALNLYRSGARFEENGIKEYERFI